MESWFVSKPQPQEQNARKNSYRGCWSVSHVGMSWWLDLPFWCIWVDSVKRCILWWLKRSFLSFACLILWTNSISAKGTTLNFVLLLICCAEMFHFNKLVVKLLFCAIFRTVFHVTDYLGCWNVSYSLKIFDFVSYDTCSRALPRHWVVV